MEGKSNIREKETYDKHNGVMEGKHQRDTINNRIEIEMFFVKTNKCW